MAAIPRGNRFSLFHNRRLGCRWVEAGIPGPQAWGTKCCPSRFPRVEAQQAGGRDRARKTERLRGRLVGVARGVGSGERVSNSGS